MPSYHRRRHAPGDPARDCLISLLGLVVTLVCTIGLFAAFSQPGAWRFPIGPAPAPTPTPVVSAVAEAGIDWIAVSGALAILSGTTGLVILGIIWLALRAREQPARNPAPPSSAQSSAVYSRKSVFAAAPVDTRGTAPERTEDNGRTQQAPVADQTKVEEREVEADSIMTRPERAFFWTLVKDVRVNHLIFPQFPVRLLGNYAQAELLPWEPSRALDKRSVDFLLADPTCLEAEAAIELDDPSHRQADAQARDNRKAKLLHQMGIGLVRIPCGEEWIPESLRIRIEQARKANRRVALFSEMEGACFRALRQARPDLFIFPKVPLNVLLRRKSWLSPESYATLKNDLVDFVLVHPKYLGTLLVVELDEPSNSGKTNLLEKAGIPWICIDKADVAAPSQLHQKIARAIKE